MADFTKLYTKITEIQTTLKVLQTAGDYKDVLIEFSSTLLNNTRYPLCAVLLDTGNISHNVRANIDLHIIGLFHEHTAQNLTQNVLNTMEKTIAYLREAHPELAQNEQIMVYINQNVLDPFLGVELPLIPPLGGFRLTYPNFRENLDTNTI